jgi:hypothetical protein
MPATFGIAKLCYRGQGPLPRQQKETFYQPGTLPMRHDEETHPQPRSVLHRLVTFHFSLLTFHS